MNNMLAQLQLYFSYPFVRYALIVGILIALCSSLLGVTLVLKRYSFIGDGLSHVAFGAMAVASVLNLSNNMLVIMPVTILSAIVETERAFQCLRFPTIRLVCEFARCIRFCDCFSCCSLGLSV